MNRPCEGAARCTIAPRTIGRTAPPSHPRHPRHPRITSFTLRTIDQADHNRQSTMKRSTDRFLTTHTGSLPRPEDLIRMMFAKEEGLPVEPGALASRIRDAVAHIVNRQA